MNPQTLAPFIAAHAVTSIALGLAISALAWTLLRVMFNRNSASRFAVLYAALLAIVAAFFLYRFEPHNPSSYSSHLPALRLSLGWALSIFYIWAAIALASLARIAFGLVRLRQLRRSFLPIDLPELRSLLEQRLISGKRAVQLCHSPLVRVPAAIGFFKPAVVLASWSLSELSPEELKTAVLHELAHVDRWDDWTNLAQKVIRALLFFHPAVWWIDMQLGVEREMSCDDAVLAQSASPHDYAKCLVSLAEKSFVRRKLALAQAAVGHMKQTAARIGRILDGRNRKSTSAWKPALAAMAVFTTVGVIAVQCLPELVVFQAAHPASEMARAKNNRVAPAATATAAHPQPLVTEAAAHKPAFGSNTLRTAKKQRPDGDEVFSLAGTPARHAPVVNASAKESGRSEFMYVVMQTRDYDGSGMVRVTTSVWRVRLTSGPTRDGISAPPHST